MENLEHWFYDIRKSKNIDELAEVVLNYDLSSELQTLDFDYEKYLHMANLKYKELDDHIKPYLLDVLYRADNRDKFTLFAFLFEMSCKDLEFITNLERYQISREKFVFFLPTLIRVADKCQNKIGDCMYLILLNCTSYLNLCEGEGRATLTKALFNRIYALLELMNGEVASDSVIVSLGIAIAVTRYLNDNALLDLVQKAVKIDNNHIKWLSIITLIANDRSVDSSDIEIVADCLTFADQLYGELEEINKTELYPKDKVNQAYLAKSNLINWLAHPAELGREPTEIELLGIIDRDDIIYCIFKFLTDADQFKERGWMLGVAGGYLKDEMITSKTNGNTFSIFEPLGVDYISQGERIIESAKGRQ